jgi:hypothetical protein
MCDYSGHLTTGSPSNVKYHESRHLLESRGTESSFLQLCGRFWSTLGPSHRFPDFSHDLAAFDKVTIPCSADYLAAHTLCSSTSAALVNKIYCFLISSSSCFVFRRFRLRYSGRCVVFLTAIFDAVCQSLGENSKTRT